MGDVPINYIEGIGGTRVSEDDIVAVGKHDVSSFTAFFISFEAHIDFIPDPVIQSGPVNYSS